MTAIRDSSLSEKLQLDYELTLTKAVTLVRQAEAVKQQQPLLTVQNHPAGVIPLWGQSSKEGVAMAEEKVKDQDKGFPE